MFTASVNIPKRTISCCGESVETEKLNGVIGRKVTSFFQFAHCGAHTLNQCPTNRRNIIIGQKVKGNGTVRKGDGIIADNLVSFFHKQKLVGRTNFFTGLQKGALWLWVLPGLSSRAFAQKLPPQSTARASTGGNRIRRRKGRFSSLCHRKVSSFPLAGLTRAVKSSPGSYKIAEGAASGAVSAPKDPIAQAGTGSANLLGQMGFFRKRTLLRHQQKRRSVFCRRTQGLF